MESDLYKELTRLARAERRSVNKQIIVFIEQAVMRAALVEQCTDPHRKDGGVA